MPPTPAGFCVGGESSLDEVLRRTTSLESDPGDTGSLFDIWGIQSNLESSSNETKMASNTLGKNTLEKEGPSAPQTSDGPKPVLVLPKPPAGTPKELLTMKEVELCWQDAVVLSAVSLKVEKGMRIAVRGPNGAGKSTLLSGLSQKLPLAAGERIEGDNLAMGVFTQDLAQDLDQSARAVDVVTSAAREYDPTISDEKARSVLGALGLRQEKALRLVGHLSGGEKARVALASFVLIPHNFLLLDEPTNHLDAATVTTLVEALSKWEGGAVMAISHDRSFLERLRPTHVLTVRGGTAVLEERGLKDSDWEDDLNSRVAEAKFAPVAALEDSTTTGAAVIAKATGADQDLKKRKFNAQSVCRGYRRRCRIHREAAEGRHLKARP